MSLDYWLLLTFWVIVALAIVSVAVVRLASRSKTPVPINETALLGAILFVVLATSLIDTNHSYFVRPLESLRDITRNFALLGIFALGATVVILAGGIDLSAG